ncbi:MAG TPA: histidine kinase dimerization/phospho-acceptor domain-containing protein [Gemmatimonadaceae bacterium]|nr:histidine kinase dimerization/phospho-acceptor domain-containing protein [Gemmatimonadaceae bacterium]
MMTSDRKGYVLLMAVEDENRAPSLQQRLSLILPRASILSVDTTALAEEKLPRADAALIDGGPNARATVETLRVLRARGFDGPIIVVAAAPDDAALREMADSLGAGVVERARVDRSPLALAEALTAALESEPGVTAELRQARRIFAAGQSALSLQHAINNPLAALLAEAQLLQLEELTAEQRGSVDRMVELCRRVVALVRRLDALSES